MNKEAKNLVKKTAKIAGVTCLTLGSAALIASGAALKALTEGAQYLKNTIQKIVKDTHVAEAVVDAVPAEAACVEGAEMPAVEAAADAEG